MMPLKQMAVYSEILNRFMKNTAVVPSARCTSSLHVFAAYFKKAKFLIIFLIVLEVLLVKQLSHLPVAVG